MIVVGMRVDEVRDGLVGHALDSCGYLLGQGRRRIDDHHASRRDDKTGQSQRSRHTRLHQPFGDDIPLLGPLWGVPAREAVKIVASLSPCLIAIQVYFRHMKWGRRASSSL